MIRVIRVLQYEYTDAERMARDMVNWTTQLDARTTRGVRMTSAIVNPPEWVDDDTEPKAVGG